MAVRSAATQAAFAAARAPSEQAAQEAGQSAAQEAVKGSQLRDFKVTIDTQGFQRGGTLTVTGDADLAEAVDLMTSTAVKSLPVIDEHHHVVGVLSRRDVVHLLARRDDAVEREMDALFQSLGVDWLAEVSEGVVTVMGPVDERERALARTAAATVPGVVSVTVS